MPILLLQKGDNKVHFEEVNKYSKTQRGDKKEIGSRFYDVKLILKRSIITSWMRDTAHGQLSAHRIWKLPEDIRKSKLKRFKAVQILTFRKMEGSSTYHSKTIVARLLIYYCNCYREYNHSDATDQLSWFSKVAHFGEKEKFVFTICSLNGPIFKKRHFQV